MRRAAASRRRSTRSRAVPVLLVVTLVVLLTALWREAGSRQPMSSVDEHMHLDTHAHVHDGTYPHRGSLMTMEVVREWACGVGHEAGDAMAPCEHPDLGPNSLPSGIYTSGYIHYPTYFVLAEGYRSAAEAVGGGGSFVTPYRHFAALVAGSGILLCLLAGWQLGFRGARLLAATFAPSAAAGILLYGTIANPQSSAVLTGALIAWSGLRWVLGGHGFWWFAAATALAASLAVVQSLPAGVFMVAMVATLVLRRLGWTVPGPWRPRWWQLGLLTVIVVTPVVAYGRWLESRATIPNSELYGFASFDGLADVVRGALWELSILHTPWYESVSLGADPQAPLVQHASRAAVQGVPLWMTLAVFAPLAVVAGRAVLRARAASTPEDRTRTVEIVPLLVVSAFVTLVLFPPALRVSNAFNVGFDYPVVSRYAISFVPVLVWLVLLAAPGRPVLGRVLATLGTVGVLGVGLAIW